MKKMMSLRTAVSLIISLVMVFTITGCQGNEKNPPGSSTSASNAGGGTGTTGHTLDQLDANADPVQEPLGKYDPEISITTIHGANDGAFWFPEGDDISNNIYTRTWKERLGINYSFLWTSPGSQSAEKFNIMLTSGDLPDMLSVSKEHFEQLYQAGKLEDMTDYLVEYASKYTKKYLTGDYKPLLDYVTKDGRAYGIPNGFSYHDTGNMVWIRADWLKNLGMEPPKNFAELEAVMDAFTNKDPDGNGQKDTYAIASKSFVQYYEFGMNDAYFNMFDVFPYKWIKDGSGGLQDGMFGAEQRGKTRDSLLKLAEYYKKGYLHPEFVTFDDARYQEELLSDKCGIFFRDLWAAYWPLVLHKDSNPEADWIPVEIPGIDGKPAYCGTDVSQVQNVNVVIKGAKNPEALVKMCNLYHDLNNNPETMEFAKYNTDPKDNNQIFLAYPFLIYNPSFNYEGYQAISKAFKSGSADGLSEAYRMFYDQAKAYRDTGDKMGWPPYRSYTSEGCLNIINSYIENKRFKMNEYTDTPTQFQLENESVVKKMYDQMFVQIVLGKAGAEAFDQFIASYDKLYYNTAKAEKDEWFKNKGGQSLQEWFNNK